MAESTRRWLAVPITIIVLGVAWLLMVSGVGPGIDWLQFSGLALVAVVLLLVSGVDKFTVVLVPWFLLASACSVLHDTHGLSVPVIVPILTIALGLLVLLAILLPFRRPWFMTEDDGEATTNR